MTKAISKTYFLVDENRRKIVIFLLAGCGILLAIYSMNVWKTIARTVAIQKIEAENAVIGQNLDNLDQKYLSLTSKIIPDSLSEYNLLPGRVSLYINRDRGVGLSKASTLIQLAGGHEL